MNRQGQLLHTVPLTTSYHHCIISSSQKVDALPVNPITMAAGACSASAASMQKLQILVVISN